MTFWSLTNSDVPIYQTFHQFHDLDTELDLHRLWVVSMEHLQRVWHVSRERLPLRTPGSVPFLGGLHVLWLLRPVSPTIHRLNDLPKLTFTELRGFHGAFATGVACQQGALTLPDTWFRPPFWDLLMLQLLRPNSSNLPCHYSTFHLEYPLVLSRFCSLLKLTVLSRCAIAV